MGIYKNKVMSHVGVISAIAVATTGEDGKQAFTIEAGHLTKEYEARISEVIAVTSYYDLASNPLRFYLVDKLEPTQVVKISSGGIRGRTYLDVSKLAATRKDKSETTWINEKECTSRELAETLNGATWD